MDYAYFGFKKMPFDKELSSQELFTTYDQKESLARLNYIKQHRGIFLLTGEPGGGKTSILRSFVDSLNPQCHECCYTPHATISASEIYRQINTLLNLRPVSRKSQLFEQAQRAIWDKYRHQGITPCFILDECHLMGHETLQELVLLTNFEMDSKVPFILILSGQPPLKDMLKRRNLEALSQRINLRYHVAGLSEEESREYICYHLKLAGRDDPLFEENCFEMIHQLGLGLPRRIGNLCKDAMIYAQMKKSQKITAEMVHEASAGV